MAVEGRAGEVAAAGDGRSHLSARTPDRLSCERRGLCINGTAGRPTRCRACHPQAGRAAESGRGTGQERSGARRMLSRRRSRTGHPRRPAGQALSRGLAERKRRSVGGMLGATPLRPYRVARTKGRIPGNDSGPSGIHATEEPAVPSRLSDFLGSLWKGQAEEPPAFHRDGRVGVVPQPRRHKGRRS